MIHGSITIDSARCKGCQLCAQVCPQNVISMDNATLNAKGYHPARLDESQAACTGCAVCAVICPDVCITVYREGRPLRASELAEVRS